MVCEVKRSGDVVAISCGPRGGRRSLGFCVACLAGGVRREAAALCDAPIQEGQRVTAEQVATKTCSKGMCREHRHTRDGRDLCRDHRDFCMDHVEPVP